MEIEIVVAIIAAVGGVMAAAITGILNLLKKESDSASSIHIRQSQKGKNNKQIGIQNNYMNGKNNE